MCFDSNGNAPKNQAEFNQNFNSDVGIGPGFAGFATALARGSQPAAPASAPYQSVYNKPLTPEPPAAPVSSPYPSAYTAAPAPQTQPGAPAPRAGAYGGPPTSIGDVMRQSAPSSTRATGSGRVVG